MIIVGQLATSDGMALQSTVELTASGRGAIEYCDIYAAPAIEYRSEQPGAIFVDVDHTGPAIGTVEFLAQRGHGLFAVVDVDEDKLPDPPWYFSAELEGHRDADGFRDITLQGVAIVERSATIAKTQAQAVVGSLDDAHLYHANSYHRDLLREAADYARARRCRYRPPHVIAADPHAKVDVRPATITPALPRLELRSASTGDVHGRTIELIAIPHETETPVLDNGRVVTEVCTRGAFASTDVGRRIPVNRDHVETRLIGRVTSLDAWDARGLIAQLRIAPTILGDESLELARDGCLDASVGMAVSSDGVTWNTTRTRKRINRALLHHVALTATPAYPTANVLNIRSTR